MLSSVGGLFPILRDLAYTSRMAKPFDGFTKQEEKAIHQALIEANLKRGADWPKRILPDITTVMIDLCEGDSVPGAVAFRATEQRELQARCERLKAEIQAYEQMGERQQWHLDSQLGVGGCFRDVLNIALSAARLAGEKPNPHVHYQGNGAPKNRVMHLAVSALLEKFEKATGIRPKLYATAHNKDGYDGNFYKFAVACLAPMRLIPAKSLGSAILAEYKEWKRVEKENRNPTSKRAKIKK